MLLMLTDGLRAGAGAGAALPTDKERSGRAAPLAAWPAAADRLEALPDLFFCEGREVIGRK